ncbi:fatty acid desaturase [Aquabacterium sp. CECT 9606]|uniref:fatty acid desaturase family protein n=1 Tax=Aquabacterium sp. CECT 9606 TaxID=2845822 RepID=UPI001E478272|nr:fatty acid desaturase [Aquabacterium sp. CECT 9606]CAH0355855.1 hypothetical protein AQB9606_04458 [Aquabacterium sp. CECT 9606]
MVVDHSIKVETMATSLGKTDLPEHSADVRIGKALLLATRPFAEESRGKSRWLVISTFVLLFAALVCAGVVRWWPARTASSILAGLLMVRAFITYHDFLHGAILRDSRLASLLFSVYGCVALSPPRSWKQTHNHHHGHVGQIAADAIGSFPIITTCMWREASLAQRLKYRASRNPLTVLFGYLTIFMISLCLLPFLRSPKSHWDSAFALLAHGGLIALLWVLGGVHMAFFVVILPMFVATMLGSYLFFAQHSFKRMQILSPASWTFYRAALVSSSYMRLNRIMQWFTGNIGYHHIHHLNVRIPFYRLPEAMAAIPELQSPLTTSLAPREIVACFRSNLWDERLQRMVTYRQASLSP